MVYQDLGLSMKVLLGMLGVINNELHGWDVFISRKRYLVVAGEYFVIFYVGELQGGEVFLAEAS